MKNLIIYILPAIVLCFMVSTGTAQESTRKIQTIEFKVSGVCEMCEERIENAALIKGVKMAEWDLESQIIKVIFNPKKISEAAIHSAIADAGHDTEKVKANKTSADKLPACCRYRDGVEKH